MAKINTIMNNSSELTIDPGASGDSSVQLSINTTGKFCIGVDDSDSDKFKISQGSVLGTNDTFVVNTIGTITKPMNPCYGEEAADQLDVTGNGTSYTVTFTGSEYFDQGGNFSSPYFSAPVTGRYLLSGILTISGLLSTHGQCQFRIVTSNNIYLYFNQADLIRDPSTQFSYCGSVIADLDAADTANLFIYVASSTKVIDVIGAYTYFSGCLIS